jgi:hypothetical protein
LRDVKEIKHHIVRYLAYRAINAQWRGTYQKAAQRYMSDPTDVSLFGVLIRDVEPKQEDIQGRTKMLAEDCPPLTLIELHALYIPEGSMEMFVNHVKSQRSS